MSNIKIQDQSAFREVFLKTFLAVGFGRMQKRDIDVLVMHLLISDGIYRFPEDFFKAARELSLTEAKVRNLYQEVQLRYQQLPEEKAKKAFVEIIRKRAFELKGGRMLFIVRDPMLSQWFQEWVACVDGFTDSSFNPNLISINKDILVKVLKNISIEQIPKFEKDLDRFNQPDGRNSKINLFVEEFVRSAGQEAGCLSVQALATVLATFLGVMF